MTPAEFKAGILGERGPLKARLARTAADIAASQRLRYHVFYEEMKARPGAEAKASGMDRDAFDLQCDHLLVVQQDGGRDSDAITVEGGELVGSYRLLRQDVAKKAGGFYSQSEFDLAPLVARHPDQRFLELGRSCVLAKHRGKPVVELLWQGIWNYVRAHKLDVMVGCASFEGTDPDAHADALAFLARNASAPPEWLARAQASRYVTMNRRPAGEINQKSALRGLPPLIKGYLRLGCYIGDGCVIDREFNTIDVLIILPVASINPRYFDHFGAPET